MIKKSSFGVRKLKTSGDDSYNPSFEKELLSEELLESEKDEICLDGITELLMDYISKHSQIEQ